MLSHLLPGQKPVPKCIDCGGAVPEDDVCHECDKCLCGKCASKSSRSFPHRLNRGTCMRCALKLLEEQKKKKASLPKCIDCKEEMSEDEDPAEWVCGECEKPLCEDCGTDADEKYCYDLGNGQFLCMSCAKVWPRACVFNNLVCTETGQEVCRLQRGHRH
jgi:hypothetical protein